MKIKSFFSHTIEDAIGRARQEWGPEAMLVHSRRTGPEARHLGAYEVVFADGAPAPKPPGLHPLPVTAGPRFPPIAFLPK